MPKPSRRGSCPGADADGCAIAVRAQPNARRDAVVGTHAGALKVAVTAPPEGGRANDAVAEVLRRALGLKRSQVELIAGPASRDKTFRVRGLTAEELAARVAALAAGG